MRSNTENQQVIKLKFRRVFQQDIVQENNDKVYKKCTNNQHKKPCVGSEYPAERVPIELFRKHPNDPNSPLYDTCIYCRNYMTKCKNERDKNRKLYNDYKSGQIENPHENKFEKCIDRNHETTSEHPKDRVPIELFYKQPGNPFSGCYKACKDCRDANYEKRNPDKERIANLPIEEVIRKEVEKENEKEQIKLTREQMQADEDESEEDDEDQDSDEELNDSEYETDSDHSEDFISEELNFELHEKEETIICPCKDHDKSCVNAKYPSSSVPKKLFLKNADKPEQGYYKTCIFCRLYNKKGIRRQRRKRNRLLATKSHDKLRIACLCEIHNNKSGSKFSKHKVPVNKFKKNKNDPNCKIDENCKDCKKYYSQKHKQRKSIIKEKAEVDGKYYCVGGHAVDTIEDMAKKKDGTLSSKCLKCKQKEKIFTIKLKECLYKIKMEYIEKYQCSCQNCKGVFLKPIGDALTVSKLDTFMKDNVNYLIYEGKEYKVLDFLIIFKDLIELRIIEFDHLSEEEQRKRGLLRPDEPYEKKFHAVRKCGSEASMRREAKKCQILCSKCHSEKTWTETTRIIPTYYPHQRKLNYINELKKCGCSACGYKDENFLKYFDMDHLDPKLKVENVSRMAFTPSYSLEDVINECEKCRVLCRMCHLIHSDIQRQNSNITFDNSDSFTRDCK